MVRQLCLAILLFLAAGCGRGNSLLVDEPLSEDLPTALKQINKRVAARATKYPFPKPSDSNSSSSSSGRGAGRYATVANGVISFPNFDLQAVCGLPVSLDAYVPQDLYTKGNVHTMVLVHGGGWIGGTRDVMNSTGAQFLTPRNGKPWIVANISYPLGVPMEQVFGGVACAVAWLRSTSSNGLINPEKISALGTSAGGHLVGLLAALGSRAGAARVHSAVSFVGPADLLALYEAGLPMVQQMLETVLGGPSTNAARYTQFSPVTYLNDGDSSPSIWLGGLGDPIVPVKTGSQAAYAAGPDSVTLRDFSGGHDMPADQLDYVINNWLPPINPE